jgi:hypothetical protein
LHILLVAISDVLEMPIMKQRTAVDTALGLTMAALMVGWLVSMIWAAQQPDWLRSAHTLIFVIVVSAVGAAMQARADGRLDEVELAAARFGARWGLVAGVTFISVLIFLPPFQSLLTESADAFRRFNGYPVAVEGRMFMLGVVSTFVAQEAFRACLAAGWKWSKR